MLLKKLMLRFLVTAWICLSLSIVSGQCCSGGVPIAGNLNLPTGNRHEIQLQTTYDYNRLRALFSSSDNLNDRSRQRSTHSALIEASYGLTDKWSVASLFSYVVQERIIETLPTQREFTSTAGIGDLVVLLRRTLVNNNSWGLSIGAGPKIPTGKNDVTDANGLALSADLQPGSGAWDAMFWLAGSSYNLLKDNLSFTLSATARLTSGADRLAGQQRYEFGNEYQAYFGVSDRVLLGKFLLDPLLMFRFRHVSTDIVNEFPFPNSGGTFLHAVPGIIFLPSPDMSLRFSWEVPLYRNVEGTQLATSQRITVSAFFRLYSPSKSFQPLQLP